MNGGVPSSGSLRSSVTEVSEVSATTGGVLNAPGRSGEICTDTTIVMLNTQLMVFDSNTRDSKTENDH